MAIRDTYVNPIADGDQLNDGYFNGIADRIDYGSKVIGVRQTTSATSSTSAVTVDTITLVNHGADTAYRLCIYFTTASVVGNAYLTLRFTDGANNTDVEIDVGANAGSATLYTIVDIFPSSTTAVFVASKTHLSNSVPPAQAYYASPTTLASSGTWANQDSITLRHRVGTSGTLTMNGYSLQRIWGGN